MANYLSGAERHNRKMNKIMDEARKLEDQRIKEGKRPNPNLTSPDDKRLNSRQKKQLMDEIQGRKNQKSENKKSKSQKGFVENKYLLPVGAGALLLIYFFIKNKIQTINTKNVPANKVYLQGYVYDSITGNGIVKATVNVSGGSNNMVTTTDNSGAYAFALPQATQVQVTASATNYVLTQKNIMLNSSNVTTLNFNLISTTLPTTSVPSASQGSSENTLISIFPATITVNTDNLNVRSAPNTSASLSGSKTLNTGDTFIAEGYVVGQMVSGENRWWKDNLGNYVWVGGTQQKPSSTITPLIYNSSLPQTSATTPSTPNTPIGNSSTSSIQIPTESISTPSTVNLPSTSPTFQSPSTGATTSTGGISIPTLQSNTQFYTVIANDTLNSIAIKFNTSISELMSLNPQITNANLIYVGQIILVPIVSSSTSTISTPSMPIYSTSPLSSSVGTNYPILVTVNVSLLYVRSAPNSSAPLAGSQKLYYGNVFSVKGWTYGENVNGENRWWISERGDYVWVGGTQQKP